MDNNQYNEQYVQTTVESTYSATNATSAANDPLAQMANKIMVLGIVAAALSELGIPGIILAAIAGNKVKEFLAAGGQLVRKAKAGNICRRVALPISIVMTVFWVVYFIVIITVVAAGVGLAQSGLY